MFIHTLTFLNISKSSPTKTYLAYLTPNLGFIIQLSCSHVSLKMQYMSCSSTLRLPLYFAIILCLCPSLPLSFHYLGFRAGIFLVFCNVLLLHPPPTHTRSLPSFSLDFSHSEVLACADWSLKAACWLVQTPLSLSLPQAHLPTVVLLEIIFNAKVIVMLSCTCVKENEDAPL